MPWILQSVEPIQGLYWNPNAFAVVPIGFKTVEPIQGLYWNFIT